MTTPPDASDQVSLEFPRGFLWGAATSSYQIEGAVDDGGRGESIWDRFSARSDAIADGTTGKVACDHFHRWEEDLDLARQIGLGAYRFSIAWPRVIPDGRGAVNGAGLDFYDRLVDGLLARGIVPLATLYHWDLPQILQDDGGWTVRDTASAFADYARVVGERLGDRVKRWVTINEPWCAAVLGHETGVHAPGVKSASLGTLAAHYLLVAHGLGTRALREVCPDAEVGVVHLMSPGHPASLSDPDRRATRVFDASFNAWFIEPVEHGRYPAEELARRRDAGTLGERPDLFTNPEDLAIISTPTDFFGVNFYSRAIIRGPEEANESRTVFEPPDPTRTDMGWEVYPQGLYDVLMRVHTEWKPKKILITENGAAYDDGPDADGRIRDTRRIRYLDAHLRAVHRALQSGAPIGGYFCWSLLDNFEWAEGYRKRFGLTWGDYARQARVLKDSAHWYRHVIAAGGLN